MYEDLLTKITASQWKRLGIKKRAGVAVPLFSIYSNESAGIGELPDLKLLVDWCRNTNMSIIQLLPMNDTGFGFRPYDAQSMFALEPVYLSVGALEGVESGSFFEELQKIKKDFPCGGGRVNYKVKEAKLKLLWKIFQSVKNTPSKAFQSFIRAQRYWLEDYALFKVIKEKNGEKCWEEWEEGLKNRQEKALSSFRDIHKDSILFHQWLQWQLFEQFLKARAYAVKNGVFLMGDIPFLVSRDSADVWSRQDYFKLDFASGAPPDLLYSNGQRWGMPPFHWGHIGAHQYDYVIEKLRFAQNFYDLYRIDHVVGVFRLWTIPLSEPAETGGLNGVFDPKDEQVWEEHGRQLLSLMINNSTMLACAEDLGTVPEACFKTLKELGIPGIDVQRWMRDWNKTYDFKAPEDYRPCALATIATHDLSNLCAWWLYECATVDEGLFKRNCLKKSIRLDDVREKLFDLAASSHGRLRWKKEIDSPEVFLSILGLPEKEAWDLLDMYKGSIREQEQFLAFLGQENGGAHQLCRADFIKQALVMISRSSCIFSIQLIQDYLSTDPLYDVDPWDNRINFPGTLSDKNWTLALLVPLEDILSLPINTVLKAIHKDSGRE
ncbi:MAG: 4-alpha-glucanotransferase [Candidatus Omnitrophota bacterium]